MEQTAEQIARQLMSQSSLSPVESINFVPLNCPELPYPLPGEG